MQANSCGLQAGNVWEWNLCCSFLKVSNMFSKPYVVNDNELTENYGGIKQHHSTVKDKRPSGLSPSALVWVAHDCILYAGLCNNSTLLWSSDLSSARSLIAQKQ